MRKIGFYVVLRLFLAGLISFGFVGFFAFFDASNVMRTDLVPVIFVPLALLFLLLPDESKNKE